jgi:hypothetical protein
MPAEFLANTRPGDHRPPPVGPDEAPRNPADQWHEAEHPPDTSDKRGKV